MASSPRLSFGMSGMWNGRTGYQGHSTRHPGKSAARSTTRTTGTRSSGCAWKSTGRPTTRTSRWAGTIGATTATSPRTTRGRSDSAPWRSPNSPARVPPWSRSPCGATAGRATRAPAAAKPACYAAQHRRGILWAPSGAQSIPRHHLRPDPMLRVGQGRPVAVEDAEQLRHGQAGVIGVFRRLVPAAQRDRVLGPRMRPELCHFGRVHRAALPFQ